MRRNKKEMEEKRPEISQSTALLLFQSPINYTPDFSLTYYCSPPRVSGLLREIFLRLLLHRRGRWMLKVYRRRHSVRWLLLMLVVMHTLVDEHGSGGRRLLLMLVVGRQVYDGRRVGVGSRMPRLLHRCLPHRLLRFADNVMNLLLLLLRLLLLRLVLE